MGVLDNDQGKGFYKAFLPEKKLDLTQTEDGVLRPVGWRPYIADSHRTNLS